MYMEKYFCVVSHYSLIVECFKGKFGIDVWQVVTKVYFLYKIQIMFVLSVEVV